ncbi:hypothetical protein H4W30_006942 [Amycolatopsis roodepoortensis]|uniref:Uncharacterized protein n=1 Tax=Amycolatopsis roodepoortensis TaxID=700274 RepID=A0ABR9LHY3_9PSEU|nr:hypothetical protein [Amycolatopsis roodepoortensis]
MRPAFRGRFSATQVCGGAWRRPFHGQRGGLRTGVLVAAFRPRAPTARLVNVPLNGQRSASPRRVPVAAFRRHGSNGETYQQRPFHDQRGALRTGGPSPLSGDAGLVARLGGELEWPKLRGRTRHPWPLSGDAGSGDETCQRRPFLGQRVALRRVPVATFRQRAKQQDSTVNLKDQSSASAHATRGRFPATHSNGDACRCALERPTRSPPRRVPVATFLRRAKQQDPTVNLKDQSSVSARIARGRIPATRGLVASQWPLWKAQAGPGAPRRFRRCGPNRET